MLKDGLETRVFIRTAILGLRLITPLSIAYCSARLVGWTPKVPLSELTTIVDIYTASEAAFYLLVYLPRKWWLNRPSKPYVPLKTREERKSAFDQTWDATADPYGYVSLWFKGAAVEDLREEDVKDWLYWRMWNSFDRLPEDEPELEEYFSHTEQLLDIRFGEGYSGKQPMMVTTESLRMKHRPLLWYALFVGGADSQFCVSMFFHRWQFHSLGFRGLLKSFPLRPAALVSPYRSPARHLSYWYHEHTSADNLPVLFIHGIGVGLQFYLNFFHEFRQKTAHLGIGMIALEVLPMSSRVTHATLHREEVVQQIHQIFQKHGWTRCVVMTHSYGSVYATHLLRDSRTASMVGPLLFADPVTFSFHPPQVAWNFLRRKPTTASEIELEYFASTDPGVAHALTRSFVWTENSLWREEVESRARGAGGEGMRCTVALAGKDIITDTNTLGRYLTRPVQEGVKWYEEKDPKDDGWKTAPWTGDEPIEVIWSPGLNHAEVFDEERDRSKLITVLIKYSRDGAVGRTPLSRRDCDEASGLLHASRNSAYNEDSAE